MKNLITPKQLHTNQNEIMPLIITGASVDVDVYFFVTLFYSFCRDQLKKQAAAAAEKPMVMLNKCRIRTVTNFNGKKLSTKSQPMHRARPKSG